VPRGWSPSAAYRVIDISRNAWSPSPKRVIDMGWNGWSTWTETGDRHQPKYALAPRFLRTCSHAAS